MIGEARVLREELEAVEAAMQRIKELWMSPEFPCLKEVASAVRCVDGSTQDVIERAGELPTADHRSYLSEVALDHLHATAARHYRAFEKSCLREPAIPERQHHPEVALDHLHATTANIVKKAELRG